MTEILDIDMDIIIPPEEVERILKEYEPVFEAEFSRLDSIDRNIISEHGNH